MRTVLLALLLIAPTAQASGFLIPGTSSISVQLRHPEGRPLPGVAVLIRNSGGLVLPSITYTDRMGDATFPVLCPGDDYEIRVYVEGQEPFAFDRISLEPYSSRIFLINPNAPYPGQPAGRKLDSGGAIRRQETHAAKPWIEWRTVRDPQTGSYRLATEPERLSCPDGIRPIQGTPNRETLRWLRRGFEMKLRIDALDPAPPLSTRLARADGAVQGSKDQSKPTSTSDWSGTSRSFGPS
jgi:hypothetical protein